MKASTKIKKYVHYGWIKNNSSTIIPVVLMVDGKREYGSYNLNSIDDYHLYLTKDMGYSLLPLNECPVCNGKEIIMHYTSTTYKDWCNLLVK